MNKLSKIIREHRKKAGLTQKQLADLAGVGKTLIFDIEKGKISIQFNSILSVLEILNIKIKATSPLMNKDEVLNEKS